VSHRKITEGREREKGKSAQSFEHTGRRPGKDQEKRSRDTGPGGSSVLREKKREGGRGVSFVLLHSFKGGKKRGKVLELLLTHYLLSKREGKIIV